MPLGAVWHAYFPELVDPDQMAMANGWIFFGSSLASLVGPGLAGRAKGSSAPMALLADSVSYLAVVSGLFRIRHTDVRYPDRSLKIQGVTEIVQSLRVSVANSASRFLCGRHDSRTLIGHVPCPVHSVCCARSSCRHSDLWGFNYCRRYGRVIRFFTAMASRKIYVDGLFDMDGEHRLRRRICGVALAKLGQPLWLMTIILSVSAFLAGFSGSLLSVYLTAIRQVPTPERFLGPVFVSQRMGLSIVAIIGSLLAGILAKIIGLRPSILLALF